MALTRHYAERLEQSKARYERIRACVLTSAFWQREESKPNTERHRTVNCVSLKKIFLGEKITIEGA